MVDNAKTEMTGLAKRLRDGGSAVLARAISIVESEASGTSDILKAIQPHLGRALVVGFTGPPGAGKSTLVNAYIAELRRRDKTVGVVAVDPSSPITGGAVLGDRIRMSEHTLDPGVFIRSLASRGHLGGLSPTTARVADLMDAAGRDVVILETVGAGQSEVEMAKVADIKIVVSAPGLGDDVQAIKAGILEIADILVVNKADLPLAKHTTRQLENMLALRVSADWQVPVVSTNALNGDGVLEMADAIERYQEQCIKPETRSASLGRSRRLLAQAVGKLAEKMVLDEAIVSFDPILQELQDADIDVLTAARCTLKNLHEELSK